jgi:IS30 family transposase
VNEIQRLHGENMPITDIAKTLNVARTTVYRHLEEQQDKQKADSSDK